MKKVVASLLGLALVVGLSGGVMAADHVKKVQKTATIAGVTYTYEMEPNNTEGTGDSYTEGNIYSGELPNVLPTDRDYFLFTAQKSGTYRFKIQPTYSQNQYELAVGKSGLATFKRSTTQFDTALVAGQSYYVRIMPAFSNYDYPQTYTASVNFVQ